jgi:hypothetical protein
MNKNHSNISHDLSTSCTKNVAIGRLLDIYTNDPIRANLNPSVDPDKEQKNYIYGLNLSIFEIISDERAAAQFDKDQAIEENDKEKKHQCDKRIFYWDNQMRLAHQYLCEIDDELAKGESSKLRIDHGSTSSPSNPHITLVSLSDWAEGIRHEISERVNRSSSYINSLSAAASESNEKELNSAAATNLYITFALLVEDYAKLALYIFKDGVVNRQAVSQHIADLAVEKTKTPANPKGDKVTALTAGKIADNMRVAFERLENKFK